MSVYDTWKRGFNAWEKATAEAFENLLRNPAVLTPAGAMLSAATRAKAASDRAAARFWGSWGLSTKRDQERVLHKLNQLESRLLDLAEELED